MIDYERYDPCCGMAIKDALDLCAKAVCPDCAAGNKAHRVESLEGRVGDEMMTKRVAYLHVPTHSTGLVQLEMCKADGIWKLEDDDGS